MTRIEFAARRLAAACVLLVISVGISTASVSAKRPALPLAQSCPEWHEPNDSLAQATNILPNRGVVYSAICPRASGWDDDWFSFDVFFAATINVALGEPPADYDIRLYDPDGVDVASSVRSGFAAESITYQANTAGRWAVHVFAKQGDSSSTFYPLDVRVGTYSNDCAEWFEPNDSFGDAVTISTGISYDGYLCDPWDEDWFAFSLSAGDEVTVDLYNLPADYDLRLYDPAFQSIGTSQSSGTSSEQIEATAARDGLYRLLVSGYMGAYDHDATYSVQVDVGAAGSGCNEWFEPNESFEAAATIQPGMSYEGFICDGDDMDWFKFPVVTGGRVTVDLTNVPADYDLRVYDPGGTLVGDSASGGTSPEHVEVTALVDGDYRAYVFGYGDVSDPDHTYSLLVQVLSSGGGCNEWFEPNESISESKELTPGLSQDGYICNELDVDFFFVTVQRGNEISARLSLLPEDYDIELFDPSGDSVGSSRNSGTADEKITYRAQADGNHYLKVSGYRGASSSTSVYQVVMHVRTAAPTCDDYFEPNENFDAAALLTPGLPQAGHICTAQDVDWFRFPARADQEVTVALYALPADFDLNVYDPTGTLVEQSAAGGTASERVSFIAAMGGDYRAFVSGYGDTFDPVNAYTIEATVRDVGVPPSATPTPSSTPNVPTATPTPSLTARPKPTATATRTARPKPSSTATASATPASATATATRTNVPKPTSTPTPSFTPKPTVTGSPSPSATQRPTLTATLRAPSRTPSTTPSATGTAAAPGWRIFLPYARL